MAVPDSLAKWRAFMEYHPQQPEQLKLKALRALSEDAKEEYDRQRFAWIGADVVLETKDFEKISQHLRIVQARIGARSSTAGRAFAISGRAGLGKSTTAITLARMHESQQRKKLGDGADIAPVVYAVVPPGATPKMLMRAFATWLGMQVPPRLDAPTVTNMVVKVMERQQVSMVIVDELHNLRTRSTAGAEAASQLKVFTERVNAAFVYCGIDLLSSDLFNGEIGEQIRARTKMYALEPYSIGSKSAREAWEAIVLGMEDLLPLADHPTGSLGDMATYLYHRTSGSVGSLRTLLGDAAIGAIIMGTERVDRELLDDTILDEESARLANVAPLPPEPAKVRAAS